MAAETTTFTPKKFWAGSDPDLVTRAGTLLSGQNLASGTPLAADAAGKLFSHPGNTSGFVAATSAGSPTVALDTTVPVAGILIYAVNASTGTTDNNGATVAAGVAADTACLVIKAGDIFSNQLSYTVNGGGAMAAVSTDILKQKLFNGSLMVLTFQDVGEV